MITGLIYGLCKLVGIGLSISGVILYLTKPKDETLQQEIIKPGIANKIISNLIVDKSVKDYIILKHATVKIPGEMPKYYLGIFQNWFKIGK